MLASVAEQASLNLTWSETPKDTFSHDGAHVVAFSIFRLLMGLVWKQKMIPRGVEYRAVSDSGLC